MKRILRTGILGEEGIALVHRVVSRMGCLWHPTGGTEAGIDGFIEFRDPSTNEVLNLLLPLQSKATDQAWASETDHSFSYICEQDDLDYWMQGNRPIVLVVSRPRTDEAYWVSIKDYFEDPARRRSRKILFDKKRDRFEAAARDRLLGVAAPRDGGTYFAPLRKPETLITNLLRVARLPEPLFSADVVGLMPPQIRARLVDSGYGASDEWVVRRNQLLTVYDLHLDPWRGFVDLGTTDEFDTATWAHSADPDMRSDFLALLYRCLGARLARIGVQYDPRLDHYFFVGTEDLTPRRVGYHSLARDSSRTVFQGYPRKDGSGIAYYRHSAFEARFRDYDGDYFLQIDPTYRFTEDGKRVLRWYESKLKGILAQENNPAVLGQVVMWADLLRDSDLPGLFDVPAYPHIQFGELVTLECPAGINDDLWLTSDESAGAKRAAEEAKGLNLFAPAEP